MDKWLEKVERASHTLEPAWEENPHGLSGVMVAVERRRQRRRAVRVGVACLMVCGLTALLWSVLESSETTTEPVKTASVTKTAQKPPVVVANPEAIRLTDGSIITPSPDTTGCCVLKEISPERAVVVLERGRAKFEISKRPTRTFIVQAGGVEVRVLGTVFDVDRGEDEVEVVVHEGRVSVETRDGRSVVLNGGERGTFVPQQVAQVEEPEPVEAPKVVKTPKKKRKKKRAVVARWQDFARAGDSERAAELLLAKPRRHARGVAEKFLAADTLRQAREPASAVGYLDDILSQHASDRRTALAAFTKGRVLSRDLRRPCKAAAAFSVVEKYHPARTLAQDALAKEVESWAKCGKSSRVRERGQQYLSRYPQGPHRAKMERLMR